MQISNMNWQQVEAYLAHDDRAVLPLGSTEQHAYLSLSVDSILSERVSVAAAEPLGVPVFPVLAYGITPAFRAYPGIWIFTALLLVGYLLAFRRSPSAAGSEAAASDKRKRWAFLGGCDGHPFG